MNGWEITGLIKSRGLKIGELADRLEVCQSAVSHIIHGRRRSERIARAIADELGMSVEQLWPPEGEKDAGNK
jgi:plasmid maintenance system antidote protein VapI